MFGLGGFSSNPSSQNMCINDDIHRNQVEENSCATILNDPENHNDSEGKIITVL